MKRATAARIRAALDAQRASLETHRDVETPLDVRRCRVAARRLRVIVHATRPIVGDKLAPLREDGRWVAEILGPVRDLDVLLEHVRPQVETLDDDVDGAKLVVAALERQRLFRAREAKEALASPRYDTFLDLLGAAIGSILETDHPLSPLVSQELKKLRKAVAQLNGVLSDAEIHALRIRAKRARYSAELLGGARWERAARALARVQDLAGAHQDAVRAEEQLRSVSRPKTAVAVGRLIERERFRKGAQRAALPAALAKALRSS